MQERKKLILWFCFSAFVPATLLCFVIAPVYIVLASDVTLAGGFLCELFWHLTKVVDPLRFAACFAVMAFAAYCQPKASRGLFYLLFAVSSVYENLANFLMDGFRVGFAEAAEYLVFDAIYLGMDLVVLLAFGLILRHWNRVREARRDALVRAKKYLETLPENAPEEDETHLHVVPDRKNPLQMTLLGSVITVTAFLFLNGLIYDFSIGMPSGTAEWLSVVWFYFSLLIAGFLLWLGQLGMVKIMNRNARR